MIKKFYKSMQTKCTEKMMSISMNLNIHHIQLIFPEGIKQSIKNESISLA